jgi:uncharacterized protein
MYTIKLALSNPVQPFSSSNSAHAPSFIQPLQIDAASKPMLTPCIGICELRSDGLCEGCLRTSAEIGGWSSYTDSERAQLMDVVLPSRQCA